jgi:hypothetical protein
MEGGEGTGVAKVLITVLRNQWCFWDSLGSVFLCTQKQNSLLSSGFHEFE